MTKPEIAQLIRQANNASDPEKRQNLIDAIPKNCGTLLCNSEWCCY